MDDILIINDFTIISAAALLVVAIVSALFNPFLRFRKPAEETAVNEDATADSSAEDGQAEAVPVSVILTPHDEAEALKESLPLLLDQDYPVDYQVIVIVEQGYPDTEDVVKHIQNDLNKSDGHASLYMTYIPESSRYMSRKKLAMTLGVKASRTEWVLLTEAYTRPSSRQWLRTMTRACDKDARMVIGYGGYSNEATSFKRFERLNMAYYLMREDSRGQAYRTLSHNLLLRKSDFMASDGFLGTLNLIRGEYDALVNKFSTTDGTRLVTDSSAWMIDDAPTHKTWMNAHIFYIETRKWLQRNLSHRVWFNLDQTLLHLNFICIIAAIIYAALALNLIVGAAAVASLLLTIILRTVFGHKAAKAFGQHFPILAIYPYELSLIWHNLGYIIRHRLANKLDFTTHKQ